MTLPQLRFAMPVAGLEPVTLTEANLLMVRWGHNLGPCERPFGFRLLGAHTTATSTGGTVGGVLARSAVAVVAAGHGRRSETPTLRWSAPSGYG